MTARHFDLSGPVELIPLAVKNRAVRCRLLASDDLITVRARSFWKMVPGEIEGARLATCGSVLQWHAGTGDPKK